MFRLSSGSGALIICCVSCICCVVSVVVVVFGWFRQPNSSIDSVSTANIAR